MKRSVLALLSIVIAAGVASCSSVQGESSSASGRGAVTIPAGTVVGTGTLVSDVVDVEGTLEVVATGGPADRAFEIRLHGLSLPEGFSDLAQFRLVAAPAGGDSPCVGSWGGMPFHAWTGSGSEWSTAIAPLNVGGSDPSYLESMVMLGEASSKPDANGCSVPVAIRADFEWSMPDIRPSLAPVDGGEREGAQGEVANADGVPLSYVVSHGDTLRAVAARFGITVDDVLFLNPARQIDAGLPEESLIEGELLNLDKRAR